MLRSSINRRTLLKTTAMATASVVAAPYIRGAHAAGSLTLGCWDHWVPGANNTATAVVDEWAAREKVEVKIDYLNNLGNKLLLTTAAEAQARSGHDILAMSTWLPLAPG